MSAGRSQPRSVGRRVTRSARRAILGS